MLEYSASVALSRHTVMADELPFYYLDSVDCVGNENLLSDCKHRRVDMNNCGGFQSEAGVVCSSKFS